MSARPGRLSRLLVVLVLVTVALMLVDLRGDGTPFSALRAGATAVLGTPLRLAGGATGAVADAVGGVTGTDAREADRLRAEVDRLTLELEQRNALAAQETQLSELYGLTARGQYRTLAARVVAYEDGLVGSARTVILDAGVDAGVREDMTVVNGDGLVGRVLRVGPTTSQVLLAVDPGSSVGARLEGAGPAATVPGHVGEVGVVEGAGDAELLLRLFDTQARPEAGRRVVTFGATYVPGVPVGEVVEVRTSPGDLERRAVVRPAVDFSALDVVGVVVEAAGGDPGDAVLPPRPADAAAVAEANNPTGVGRAAGPGAVDATGLPAEVTG